MLPPKRQSILCRKLRPYSRCNEENIDEEFEKEQAVLKARQQRYRETEDFLRRCRFGEATLDEKGKLSEEFRHAQEQQLESKRRLAENQKNLELDIAHQRQSYETRQAMTEEEQRRQRAESNRRIMEENKRAAEEKRMRQKHQKEVEHARENHDLAIQAQQVHSYR